MGIKNEKQQQPSKLLLEKWQMTYQKMDVFSYTAACNNQPVQDPFVLYISLKPILSAEEPAHLVTNIR